MTGTNQLLDRIEIDIGTPDDLVTVYINAWDHSLSRKWLTALNQLIKNNYHLEKNYCFFGFADGPRNGPYIIEQINNSIDSINQANLGYVIDDHFTMENSMDPTWHINHDHFNQLHKYFEDLQGVSGKLSPYYLKADPKTQWHIRQLNLLCHEFESWSLSIKKKYTAPEWQRPSQLMCWLNAPRFMLDDNDYEMFGIESMNRSLGGVFVGVNKAVGKHHWEVFVDEAKYDPTAIVDNLTTTTLRSQTEAAGDFDIEWANNPGDYEWQKKHLADFRTWLIRNGFDPDDKQLTIGHPQCGQVDLDKTFGTTDYKKIWALLETHLNVYAIRTSDAQAVYPYHWSDPTYINQQITVLSKEK
jgi:hypothetical protein